MPGAMKNRKGSERLMRSLLSRPNRPAVVLLNTFQHPNNLPQRRRGNLYFENAEAFYFDLATYYGLTLVSLKAAAFPSIHNYVDGFWLNSSQYAVPKDERKHYFFWDNQHVGSLNGHRLLADLVIAVFHRVAKKLLVVPRQEEQGHEGQGQERATAFRLPPPIFPLNFELAKEMCIVGERLLGAVLSKMGFEWINDQPDPAKPAKLGWTSYDPGSEISFKIDWYLNQSSFTLSIGYLVSYENMGTFIVSCLSCECEKQTFDGHDSSRRVSQMSVANLRVSARHPECKINILVSSESRSGKHKVKIAALMLQSGDEGSLDPSLATEQPWGVNH